MIIYVHLILPNDSDKSTNSFKARKQMNAYLSRLYPKCQIKHSKKRHIVMHIGLGVIGLNPGLIITWSVPDWGHNKRGDGTI